MLNEIDFKKMVAENLQYYRKVNNLTQLQLAEILNYSDKSISKWERGESIPDLFILQSIANLYGITINDLVTVEKTKPVHKKKTNNLLITLIAFGIVWLVATIAFVTTEILFETFTKSWLAFIYAIPVSMIVLLVFTNIWGNKFQVFIALTVLYWTVPLSLYLSLENNNKLWLLFIIIIPLQIITIFGFLIKNDKIKKVEETTDQQIDSKNLL